MRPSLAVLVPLGVVVLYGAWRWNAWRALTGQLFRQGGAAIDTGAPSEGMWLRTLIQVDGDVLVIIHGRPPTADLLRRHQARVERWYERNRRVVRQSVGSLKAVTDGLSVAAAAESGWSTVQALEGVIGGVIGGALGLVAGTAAFGIVRLVLRWVASALLRRRVDAWLGVAGNGG